MFHLNHASEAKDEHEIRPATGREMPASETTRAAGRRTTDSGSVRKSANATRPVARMPSRSRHNGSGQHKAGPIVKLTIDIPEEQFLERIARMLLELTEHKSADGF